MIWGSLTDSRDHPSFPSYYCALPSCHPSHLDLFSHWRFGRGKRLLISLSFIECNISQISKFQNFVLIKFRFYTAENEPAKNLQKFKFCKKCIFEKCIFESSIWSCRAGRKVAVGVVDPMLKSATFARLRRCLRSFWALHRLYLHG